MKLPTRCGRWPQRLTIAIIFIAASLVTRAQDGVAGIQQANELVRKYFETGITLLYAIGAVLGLVGAIKVYSKWSQGDSDTSKAAASWFGACIFLVVVATALKSFFGIR